MNLPRKPDAFQANRASIILIIAAFVLQVLFFAPLQVLAQNFGEFSVRFVDLLMIYLALSLGLILILYMLARLIRSPFYLAILAFLGTIGFLESRLLLGFARHDPFNGMPIDWAALQWLSYLELGAIFVIGVFFTSLRKRIDLLSYISLFILLFQGVGFIHQVAGNYGTLLPDSQSDVRGSPYLDQFYRLSTNRNVIHIVPDQAQGAMLQDILTSDYEHYSSVFDGFTLFTQAMSRYQSTYPSVVYYMTGESPEPEFDLTPNQPFTWKYIDETLQTKSIVTLLSQNAFNTFGFQFHPGIFCKGPYTACTGTHDEVFAGISVNSPSRKLALTVLTGIDLALFQTTPIMLRERIYDDGGWLVRKPLIGAFTHSGILDIFTSKMQVGANPDSYNYIHHAGAHAPLMFDSDCSYIGPQPVDQKNQRVQVMCTLAQLAKMIVALKKKGGYDQTMIVINGDHGSPWLPPSSSALTDDIISDAIIGRASSLLLIKPPKARGPLEFSDKPVTLGDIPATIAAAFELENGYSGVQMFVDEPPADRERLYYTYDSASRTFDLQNLPNMTRYRVRGNVFDQRDWLRPNSASVGDALLYAVGGPSQLKMDHPEFLSHSYGFSLLEQHSLPVRWVDGKEAWVSLSPPQQGSVVLVFDIFIPAFIEGQSMEISIGDRVIAKLDANELSGNRHSVPIPDDLLSGDMLRIEFNMGKAMRTGSDTRQLSVLFSYIGLEPVG